MPGFGDSPFGEGPFGAADWPTLTFLENIPSRVRDSDTDGYLESFITVLADQADEARLKISKLPDQVDPFNARANGETELVRLASAEVEEDDDLGTVTTLTLESGQQLTEIGPGWVSTFADTRLEVVYVKTRADPNVVKVSGTPPINVDDLASVASEVLASPTGSESEFKEVLANAPVVEGTVTITADGVSDLSDDGEGNLNGADGSGTIDYLTGLVDITYTTNPGAGADLEANYDWGGYQLLTFQATNLLNRLSLNFGFSNDQNEPTVAQRSAIADIFKWLELKATARSYEIRSEIAGFTAEVTGLYKIPASIAIGLPADRTYYNLNGEGNHFTDIAPRALNFDDIVADAAPLDIYCYEDTSPDGLSEGAAFADSIGTVNVASVTGSAGDWEVTGSIVASEHDVAATYDSGRFYIDDGTDSFFVDEEVSYSAPTWVFKTTSITEPSTGGYTLKYDCPYADSCQWCRVSLIVVKAASIESILGGSDINLAAQRLFSKLEEVVPVHVKQAVFLLDLSDSVDASPTTVSGDLVVT